MLTTHIASPVTSNITTSIVGDGGAFSPLDLNPALWLDASDTSPANITESGGFVSQWSDKSGLGNHATQGTGSIQPITDATTQNGLNVIDFTSDSLILPSGLFSVPAGDNTLFIVSKSTSSVKQVLLTATNPTDTRYGINHQSGGTSVSFFNSSEGSRVNVTATISDFHSYRGSRVGTTQSISVDDGVPVTNTNAANQTVSEMHIGAYRNNFGDRFAGSFAEIIMFSRGLTSQEMTDVETYLTAKWGL